VEWDKSQTITAIVTLACVILGAIIGGVASGAWYMAKFDDRLEQIDGNLVNLANRVVALEAQDRTPDPLAQTCADLAQKAAADAANSYSNDYETRLQATMKSAGCNTPRK
jgi:ATP-dependent protease HslVU (ClpYQ) peptidase subunit